MAMYLMLRFTITTEFQADGFDWTKNELWFRNKLVIDPYGTNSKDPTKPMSSTTYGNAVRKAFENLGMVASHQIHIGRIMGAKLLDKEEIPSDEIRRVGNWNPSIQDACYSTKLPMTGIRALAGFASGNGIYYNKRTVVDVPDELQEATPIGAFVFQAIEKVKIANMEGGKFFTAALFLDFLRKLNIVFLQDMAVLMLEHPERLMDENGKKHLLLQKVDVLNSETFGVSGGEIVLLLSRIFPSNRYYLYSRFDSPSLKL